MIESDMAEEGVDKKKNQKHEVVTGSYNPTKGVIIQSENPENRS